MNATMPRRAKRCPTCLGSVSYLFCGIFAGTAAGPDCPQCSGTAIPRATGTFQPPSPGTESLDADGKIKKILARAWPQ